MHFVLLAVLATTFLLALAWWFTRKQAVPKEPVKRLSISVTEGIALVTLPVAYEVEDMWVLWEFLQGKESAVNRTRVHTLLYDCSNWKWSNVLGLEMVLWQAEPEWTGNTIFCQLSQEMKSVLDTLQQGEYLHQRDVVNPTTLRPALYFATVEEGLTYARNSQRKAPF